MTTPTNSDDVIDSRDVIARIEELQEERSALETAIVEAQEAYDEADGQRDTEAKREAAAQAAQEALDAKVALVSWDEENEAELAALTALAKEAADYAADWEYGETLIRDSYFKTYAQEFADDIGAVPADTAWPLTCIDWERAARELQQDYTQVDFDGVAYWVR